MEETLNRLKQGIQGSHMMRRGALDLLNSADLVFSPGGDNLTLGELFKELGELQYMHSQSLQTRQHDWSYRNETLVLIQDISELKAWFNELDQEMGDILNNLSIDDLKKEIDRTNGVIRSVDVNGQKLLEKDV